MSKGGHFWFGMLIGAGIMWIALSGRARAEETLTCSIGTMAPFSTSRHQCEMLSIQADAMREVLATAPLGFPVVPIITGCIRGLSANLPGHDYNTYFATCSEILQSMATVVR